MEGEVGFEGHCQMGSWEVIGSRLVAGWVLGVVERGCRVWSANLAWIASGSSKIFQANETKGIGCCCYGAERRERGDWSWFGPLVGLQERERESKREEKKKIKVWPKFD
jgi:hypothetical protein